MFANLILDEDVVPELVLQSSSIYYRNEMYFKRQTRKTKVLYSLLCSSCYISVAKTFINIYIMESLA